MSKSIGMWLIVIFIIGFLIFFFWDGRRRKRRRDDRDMVKSEDLQREPASLERNQQPAELQVGEDMAAEQSSRFEPDTSQKRVDYRREHSES